MRLNHLHVIHKFNFSQSQNNCETLIDFGNTKHKNITS